MRFFLDSLDADEARRVKEWGLLDGAVVRPDAVLAAGRDYRKVVSELSQVCDGPVFAAVAAGGTAGTVLVGALLVVASGGIYALSRRRLVTAGIAIVGEDGAFVRQGFFAFVHRGPPWIMRRPSLP